jgi:hypothetical protein
MKQVKSGHTPTTQIEVTVQPILSFSIDIRVTNGVAYTLDHINI